MDTSFYLSPRPSLERLIERDLSVKYGCLCVCVWIDAPLNLFHDHNLLPVTVTPPPIQDRRIDPELKRGSQLRAM
jgi:hypothetical protein